MHPDEEVLASIALGEEVRPEETAHASGCPRCGVLVAELRQTLARAMAASGEVLSSPPESVWQAVAGELAQHASVPTEDVVPTEEMDPADHAPLDQVARRRRRPLAWIAVAAGVAVGVVIGVIGPRLLPQPVAPAAQVLARADLRTLDTSTPGGDVELLAGPAPDLDLRIRVTPLDAGDGYLEVWLINTDLERMVSIGVLPNGSSGEVFVIPRALIEQGYVIVDISRERLDTLPEHSGESLLRGSLS